MKIHTNLPDSLNKSLAILLFAFVSLSAFCIVGAYHTAKETENLKQEAIKLDYAEWTISSEGVPLWQWKNKL